MSVLAGDIVIDSPRHILELPDAQGFGIQFNTEPDDTLLLTRLVDVKAPRRTVVSLMQRSPAGWYPVRQLEPDESVTVVGDDFYLWWDATKRAGTYRKRSAP